MIGSFESFWSIGVPLRQCTLIYLTIAMDASPKEHRGTLLALLAAYLYATDNVGAGAKLLIWFTLWYFTGGRHWLYLAWHSAGRDVRLIDLWDS